MKVKKIVVAAMAAATITAAYGVSVMAASPIEEVVTADMMTRWNSDNQENPSGKPYLNSNQTFSVTNTDTYNNGIYNGIFGELTAEGNLNYTSHLNWLGTGNGYLTIDFNVTAEQTAEGAYNAYFLTGRDWNTTKYSITSENGTEIVSGSSMAFNVLTSGKVSAAKGNEDFKLSEGKYTLKYYGDGSASDFIAVKFVPEKTYMRTVNDTFAAADMITTGNTNGNPSLSDFSVTVNDDYSNSSDLTSIFGTSGNNIGSKCYGWLGTRGTCGFKFKTENADKTYKLYVAAMHDRAIKATIKDDNGTVIAEDNMTKEMQIGTNGNNKVFAYSIDNVKLSGTGVYSVTIDSPNGANGSAPDVAAAAFIEKSAPQYTNTFMQSFVGDDNSKASVVKTVVKGDNINYIKWSSAQAGENGKEASATYEGSLSGEAEYVFGVIVPNVSWESDADMDLKVSFEK